MKKRLLQLISAKTLLLLLAVASIPSKAQVPELLYYKFDGTGTRVPNLASAPPLGTDSATIMGSLTQGPTGQCGGALIGTGNASSTDYLNTGYAPNLSGSSWTISMWTSNFGATTPLFYVFGDGNSGSFRCFTNGVAGTNNWILRGTGITDTYINGGAAPGSHISTFVYDVNTNTIYGYLDGVLVSSVLQAATPVIAGAGPFKVMGYNTNVGAPAGGLMDEFRLYNRALSATEVADLMNLRSYSTFSATACGFYTAPSGAVYTTSGTINDTIQSLLCPVDSVMTINVTINPLPTVTAYVTSDTICMGDSTILHGEGADLFTWDNSVMDSVAFMPTSSMSYIVSGTDLNGCQSNDTIEVVVNSLPVVMANAAIDTICEGTTTVLYGSGAISYIWDNGVTDNVTFSPASTSNYIVTGTDGNGCNNTDTIEVIVNTLPVVIASTSADTICNGDTILLAGSGALTYTWDNGVIDNTPFNPTATMTYILSGQDANGCSNNDTIDVVVNNLPSVSVTLSINSTCVNYAAFTLDGEAPVGGTWSGTSVSSNMFDPAVAGVGVFPIMYEYTDVNGCYNYATDTVTVDPCVSINEISTVNFTYYPNPTNGTIHVLLAYSNDRTNVQILNGLGAVVYGGVFESNEMNIDLTEIPAGIYFIKLTNSTGYSIQRLVKN